MNNSQQNSPDSAAGTQLTSEDRKNLVAYLDGELDQDTANSLEKTLAASPAARQEVEMLSKTWAILDELIPPKPSAEFTARTLNAISVLDTPAQLSTKQYWTTKTRRGIIVTGLLAILAIGAFMGFQATHTIVPDHNAPLIEELDVIENVDDYSDIGDIEFLKELQQEKLFDEETTPKPQ